MLLYLFSLVFFLHYFSAVEKKQTKKRMKLCSKRSWRKSYKKEGKENMFLINV